MVKPREQVKEHDETVARHRAERRELTNDRQLEHAVHVLSMELQHGSNDPTRIVKLSRRKQ